MGEALRVQTRFSDAEEVMAVVGGALERGWLRLPLKVTDDEPFEIVLVAADGAQALRSYAEVVERAGMATWIRFLSAAPAAETEKGSRCMLAEVDIETGDAANDEQAPEETTDHAKASDAKANGGDAVVPTLPLQARRAVLDVLPTVKMPALARASVPVLPPLLPPPPAPAPRVPAPPADSISAAVLAIEPTVEPEKLDLVELTTSSDKPIAFDTSDVTGEAKLLAPACEAKVDVTTDSAGGELEAKIADAVAAEVQLDAPTVDAPTVDARGLGNELDSVAGEIRRDTDAMPPIEVQREPPDSTIPTPFAHPPESQAAIAASLAAAVGAKTEGAATTTRDDEHFTTAEIMPTRKPRSRRAVIMASAAMCVAAAIALIVVSTHGSSAQANTPPTLPTPKHASSAPAMSDVAPPEVVAPQAAAPSEVAPEVAAPVVVAPTPPVKVKAVVADPAPAKPAVTDSAPAATPGACSVVIAASVEDAQVMIEGKPRGEAPLTAEVPCGQPVAIAVHHPRYEVYKTTVTATGQESMIAKLERERTMVAVVSDPPGAAVSLNGTPIGKTPLKTSVNRFEQSTFSFSATGYDTDWRRIMPKTGSSTVQLKLRSSDKGATRQ